MANRCAVCTHPRCDEIDAAIMAGVPHRKISAEYGMSCTSISRHHTRHMNPALVAMAAARKAAEEATLIEQVRLLVARADQLYAAASAKGSASAALAALREMRGALELLGRATGELKETGQVTVVNLLSAPEIQQVLAVILDELADHPQPRERIAARLQPKRLQLETPR